MKKKHLWGSTRCLFLGGVLLLFLVQSLGCGQPPKPRSPDSEVIPTVKGLGEMIFSLEAPDTARVRLARQSPPVEVMIKKGDGVISGDRIINVSGIPLIFLHSEEKHRFTLGIGCQASFQKGSLTLEVGTGRLCFQKTKRGFEVRVPGATLGIRGTTLDVLVRSDHSSLVFVSEGKVTIDCGGATHTIEEKGLASIGVNGSSLNVSQGDADRPDFLKEFEENQDPRTLRSF